MSKPLGRGKIILVSMQVHVHARTRLIFPFYTPSYFLYLFFSFFFPVSRRRKLKKMAIDQEKGVVFVAAKCGCGSNGKRLRYPMEKNRRKRKGSLMLHKCGLPNKYNSSNNNVAKAIIMKKVLYEWIFGYSKIIYRIFYGEKRREKQSKI